MKLTTFIAVLLLCSLERGQAQNTCTALAEAPACGCTLADGKVIDLRSVGKENGQPA